METIYSHIFKAIEESANIGGWWLNLKTNECHWTDGTRRIHEVDDDFTPTLEDAINFYLPEHRKAITESISNAINHKVPFSLDARITSARGNIKWVKADGIALFEDGLAKCLFGTFRDIEETVKARKVLSVAKRRNRITINSLIEGIITIDREGIIDSFNHAAEKMFGYKAIEVLGRSVNILMPQQPHGNNHHKYIDAYIKTGVSKIIGVGRELEARRKDGTIFPIQLGVNEFKYEGNIGFVGTIRDLSKEKESANKLKWATLYDDITGLPNRSFLVQYLSEKKFPAGITLIALDIDSFSRINLANGYEEGNCVLRVVAKRIGEVIKDNHFLARDLADRFWICLNNHHLYSQNEIDEILLNIFASVKKRIHGDHSEHFIQVTAGISNSNTDIPATTIISQAESALYEAKNNARGRSYYYQQEHLDDLLFEYNLEKKLRDAIYQGDIECWLQPKVDTNGHMVSAEVLCRWSCDGSFIPPDVFIPIAEKTDLIEDLGDYVANQTAVMLHQINQSLEGFSLAMNASPKQFLSPKFDIKIQKIFEKHQADINNLTIEITENLLLDNQEQVDTLMSSLDQSGIKISIDDFGTGYSNLKRIMDIPIKEIKVDKNFILDVTTSERSSTLVKSICQIARSLNATVVAEGVENEEISRWCVQQGIDFQQGYFHGKPMPFNHFIDHLLKVPVISQK